MNKTEIKAFLILIITGTILGTLVGDTEEIIGIVLTIKGNLVQIRGESTSPLLPGDKVFKDSTIGLEEKKGRAKVQIGSNAGPVIYTRFPVKFAVTRFSPLSSAEQDNYISCIGGTVLTSRSVTLFDWFMKNLGALAESDIKAGFSVTFSKTKNSSESLDLDPLDFKLKDDVQIKSITGIIINKDENNKIVLNPLEIQKRGSDWTITLDQYEYNYAIEYAIKATVTYMNDKTELFEFYFYVYGEEEINFIEAEAQELFGKNETDFHKAIIRAGRYRNYEMHLKGMSILKEAGVDIDGML